MRVCVCASVCVGQTSNIWGMVFRDVRACCMVLLLVVGVAVVVVAMANVFENLFPPSASPHKLTGNQPGFLSCCRFVNFQKQY